MPRSMTAAESDDAEVEEKEESVFLLAVAAVFSVQLDKTTTSMT